MSVYFRLGLGSKVPLKKNPSPENPPLPGFSLSARLLSSHIYNCLGMDLERKKWEEWTGTRQETKGEKDKREYEGDEEWM